MKKLSFMILVSCVTCVLAACGSETSLEAREELAQCVTDNGWVMYGADTCGACKAQKQLFGKAFSSIKYVECNDGGRQSEVCSLAGVEAYPTWINTEGTKLQGVQSLEDLSDISECHFVSQK